MIKLTLISSVNMCPLKRVSFSWMLCSEINKAINNLKCRFGNCPLSNQLIPLPLNDDTDMSGGNGISVLESEVSVVSGVLGVACKERVVCLKMGRKKRHKSPFLVPKQWENPTAGFSISICYTLNQNHLSPLITYNFRVMGNTPASAEI